MVIIESQKEKERIEKEFKDLNLGKIEKFEYDSREVEITTDYPEPLHRFRLYLESFDLYVEELYFYILSQLKEDFGLHNVKKITDIFSSSETSSFWGAAQNRLQITQQNVATYLKYLHDLIREMIQILRDLRILDERLDYYKDAEKGVESAWITLKGLWTELVEGGGKNATSVLGLATQVGFVTLPDLFFSVHPKNKNEVDNLVNPLKFNEQVKNVLKRKLYQFLNWYEKTYEETKRRREFTLKFFGQHYQTIKMYINWIKPYLIQAKRLQQHVGASESPDIIAAFEGAIIEIEFLAHRLYKKPYHAVVVATFNYRTRPSQDYQRDSYQHRGPAHVGKVDLVLRTYVWTEEQIQNYLNFKDREALSMIGYIDNSLKDAIDALDTEIKKYLDELNIPYEKKPTVDKKEEKKRPVMKGAAEPFMAIATGFFEIIKLFTGEGIWKSKPKQQKEFPTEKKETEKFVLKVGYNAYKNYKKSHGLYHW